MDPIQNVNPYSPANLPVGNTQPPAKNDSDLSVVDWLLCIFCAGIGCIVGIIRLVQGKGSGIKMIGISIVAAIVWNILVFALNQGK